MNLLLFILSLSLQLLEKISKLFFVLSFTVSTLLVTSCKTVTISEHQVFKATQYSYEKMKSTIARTTYSASEKDSLLSIYHTIFNTNEPQILTTSQVKVIRNFLKNDTLKAEYFVFEPQHTERVGLFFIGNTSSIPNFRDELIQLAQQTHSKIYVLNYRGYGKSEGIPTFEDQFADNTYFLRYLQKNEKKVDFVMGYSLGSVFATKLATDNKIEKLYLLSPFSNAKEIIDHQKKVATRGPKVIFRPFIKVRPEAHLLSISNTALIRNYRGSLIIFHGTKDTTLPYTMGENLYKNATTAAKKLYTLTNGGHGAVFTKENWCKLVEAVKI